tara:strand:- start:6 stop:635 length:630 start_codon:yes stop_codon:yes gene_type:complete
MTIKKQITKNAEILNKVCSLNSKAEAFKISATKNTQSILGSADSVQRKDFLNAVVEFTKAYQAEEWQSYKGKVLKERQNYFIANFGKAIMNCPKSRASVQKIGKAIIANEDKRAEFSKVNAEKASSVRGFVAKCFPKAPKVDTPSSVVNATAFNKLAKNDQFDEIVALIEEYKVQNKIDIEDIIDSITAEFDKVDANEENQKTKKASNA